METCVRGFSFMPETKVENGELKYVENEDLEKTWKIARRERLKKQEQKIWEEFITEQDIVRAVSQDDPYQFLDQVSEECIKELLDLELQKMRQEAIEEQIQFLKETKEQSLNNTADNQHIVTFVDNEDQECAMFQVFDDDKDDEISGPEEEALNDSINSPPCTVRERQEETQESTSNNLSRQPSLERICCKSSSENVTNFIENSIYCAKVKELRMKINDELINIINILENQNLSNIDPCDVPKMMKHSSEFSCRYNRVHLYQLQRQMVDIDRNSNMALPFAQRTHHQAQLVRITSLHNNILHAIQVLLKSFQQTACLGDASELVKGLIRTLRESKDCMGFVESSNIFDDTIEETCVKLEGTLNEYTTKMSDFLNNVDSTSASSKKSNNTKGKEKSGIWTKPDSKSFKNDETRLSMYSLETMRVTLNPKSSKCKDSSSSSSKLSNMKSKDTEKVESGTSKKTPRKRRPLMRGTTSTRERMPCEQDVHTLVEVIACTSSHNDINKSPQKTKLTPRTPKSNRKSTKTRNYANKTLHNNKITKEDSRKNEYTKMDSSRSNKQKDKEPKKEIEEGNLCASEKDSNIVELDSGKMRCSESKKEDRSKASDAAPDSCEVTKVLRQLCGGDGRSRNEHISGSRNAQLLCVQESSPRKPSTPQLLRILEETIQKKAPKPLFPKPKKVQDAEKYRMTLNTPENVKDDLLKYRTKFVQHMLTSSMYANSAVGKPWEKIGSVSEKIIDELLLNCAKEMELHHFVTHLYKSETS